MTRSRRLIRSGLDAVAANTSASITHSRPVNGRPVWVRSGLSAGV
jgi:hypothetical protein